MMLLIWLCIFCAPWMAVMLVGVEGARRLVLHAIFYVCTSLGLDLRKYRKIGLFPSPCDNFKRYGKQKSSFLVQTKQRLFMKNGVIQEFLPLISIGMKTCRDLRLKLDLSRSGQSDFEQRVMRIMRITLYIIKSHVNDQNLVLDPVVWTNLHKEILKEISLLRKDIVTKIDKRSQEYKRLDLFILEYNQLLLAVELLIQRTVIVKVAESSVKVEVGKKSLSITVDNNTNELENFEILFDVINLVRVAYVVGEMYKTQEYFVDENMMTYNSMGFHISHSRSLFEMFSKGGHKISKISTHKYSGPGYFLQATEVGLAAFSFVVSLLFGYVFSLYNTLSEGKYVYFVLVIIICIAFLILIQSVFKTLVIKLIAFWFLKKISNRIYVNACIHSRKEQSSFQFSDFRYPGPSIVRNVVSFYQALENFTPCKWDYQRDCGIIRLLKFKNSSVVLEVRQADKSLLNLELKWTYDGKLLKSYDRTGLTSDDVTNLRIIFKEIHMGNIDGVAKSSTILFNKPYVHLLDPVEIVKEYFDSKVWKKSKIIGSRFNNENGVTAA